MCWSSVRKEKLLARRLMFVIIVGLTTTLSGTVLDLKPKTGNLSLRSALSVMRRDIWPKIARIMKKEFTRMGVGAFSVGVICIRNRTALRRITLIGRECGIRIPKGLQEGMGLGLGMEMVSSRQ